jgi:hypothetical protein
VQTVNNEEPDGGGDVTLTTELINEVAPNLYYTDTRFDTRYATKTHYHDRYATEAEAERSGATATLEIYYTARPDGDGYAESEVSDVGETDTINRTLYYSDKFEADPDTAGDWTEYTTQPADNATFATAKAALLAGLNDTDATAETRGTLPLSLKMVRTTSAAATDLLLDTYTGAAAAYSVRKLDKDYTGYAMKVREDSGDTEADIGFDSNGDLDTAAIATHCGSANGYVVTWYDQSGNSNNATRSTLANQPQIYNGTAVITENGKPALDFDDTDDMAFTSDDIKSFFIVSTPATLNTGAINAAVGLSSSLKGIATAGDSGSRQARAFTNSGTLNITGIGVSTSQSLVDYVTTGTTGKLRYNGANEVSGSAQDITVDTLGRAQNRFNYGINGFMQEVVMWNTDQDSNRTGITTDINTYFSIY